jgi:hypothetical protein
MTKREMEMRSSAVSLSDMEIFVFPELMYSLVLANIMSPRIWRWREEPWFDKIETMRPYKRMQRLRQYIMDNYVFNLDLDTWGLTTQQEQLERFEGILDPEKISASNALFGYHGDAYYFDIDIRTHFGLDKYSTDTIPFWKTETVEAMDAFRYRKGYETGAGECVSLAALYAAALFVVARIPLEDIYMMATPLHSQNFVDVRDGVLINNRRLVTKSMWFNGTQISGQARRALENEQVTIVSHPTGWIHTLYERATIPRESYAYFSGKLNDYLKTRLTPEILGNFLRQNPECRQCFVIRHEAREVNRYLTLQEAFKYEHDSAYQVTGPTRDKLLNGIPIEEYSASYPACKIVLNDIEDFVKEQSIDLDDEVDLKALKQQIGDSCMSADAMVSQLIDFCHTKPRLPDIERVALEPEAPIELDVGMSREDVIQRLQEIRKSNVTVEMAFYALRDFNSTDPEPFILAAMERNPVCVNDSSEMELEELEMLLKSWPDESIYDGPVRLAQPDEVWNYKRGDGLEKALTLAAIIGKRGKTGLRISKNNDKVELFCGQQLVAAFNSAKISLNSEWELSGSV